MTICDTCGNDYDKTFNVTWPDGHTATFDCIECAAAQLAPECAALRVPNPGPRNRDARGDLLLRALRAQGQQRRRQRPVSGAGGRLID